MAYTPPTPPIQLDFNSPGYAPPSPPVNIYFDPAAHALVGVSAAQNNLSGIGTIGQSNYLTADNAVQINPSDVGFIRQPNVLSGSDAVQDNLSDSGAIDASIHLSGADCTQANLAGTGETVPGFPHFSAFTFGIPVGQATPLNLKVCARPRRVEIARRKVCAQMHSGSLFFHETCALFDRLMPYSVDYCNVLEQGEFTSTKWRVEFDRLRLERIKQCGTVDKAVPLASFVHAEFAPTVLEHIRWCSPVADTAKSYHVVYRIVWLDPSQPYVPRTDFVLESSESYDDSVILYRYLPPDPIDDLDLTPPGYTPPVHPALNLGADHLTAIEHHFTVYPDPGHPYVPTPDFSLPYSSQSVITREVEEIGVLRHVVQVDFQAFDITRHKRCAPVDKARKPPPGSSNIHVDPPRDPPPDPPVIYIIPERTVYMINHNLSVTLLDGTPVPMSAVSLSLDTDSYAWNFRGTLADKAAIALVQQPLNTDPVQLVVTLNGVQFKVLVERIDHTRQFGGRQINISGRGLTAMLGLPYQQPQSATQASELTVQQLAELQLPLGWTITWDLPSWLVPNGVFTYTAQTPIQVLMGMANDIGAIIKPSRTGQAMTFMRRYKVGPWQFLEATPDLIVPEAAILNLTMRPPVPININGVYVHGGEVGGVIGWCRLTGSDGARLAQTVSNNLITDVEAARLLGERILAANQTQPAIQSVTLPFDNIDFPLAEVGWLAQITVDNVPIKGIINSVNIEANLSSVRQTIQIGEETPNNWVLFKDLLPQSPLLVGTLAVTDGVTSLITLLDGGVVRVRGTGTVGNKYYIRANKIDGEAPNLTQLEIVI